LARVVDNARNPVGLAYVNPNALICARILTRDVRATIDVKWFAARLRRALEGIEALDVALGEIPERVDVIEGDMRIAAPLREGQKTGYFYDQRDNRLRLRRYVKPGDRVLDVFSY